MGGWATQRRHRRGARGRPLGSIGFVHDFVPIGLALTTTALGTLLPILHDNDMLSGDFGRYVLAAGAVGNSSRSWPSRCFSPGAASSWRSPQSWPSAWWPSCWRSCRMSLATGRLRAIVRQGRRATSQTTLRWSIALLLVLLVAAERFGLDVVLGAMLAGIVLRSWTHRIDMDVTLLEEKLDAVGYGFFIPVFFVASGMASMSSRSAENPLRLLVFFVLLLVVRGLPSLLVYRRALPGAAAGRDDVHHRDHHAAADCARRDRPEHGVMIPANAAAVAGAGVLSVLVYPVVAIALARRGGTVPAGPDAAATGPDAAGAGGVVGAARAAGEPGAAHEADGADDHGAPPAE